MIKIYSATTDDIANIVALVAAVDGDLDDISSCQFVIAEIDGVTAGCGRLKDFGYFYELASIAVSEKYRNQGVGRYIINTLVDTSDKPVYLLCEFKNVDFFGKLGFNLMDTCPGELKEKFDKLAEPGNVMVLCR